MLLLIIFVLLCIVLASLLITAGFLLAIPILAGAGACGLIVAMTGFAVSGVRGFGGDASLDALRIRPEEGAEPAYRSYFQGPVIREFGLVVDQSSRVAVSRIGQCVGWGWDRFNKYDSTWWKCFALLPVLALTIGLVIGGCLAAVILAGTAIVAGVLLGLMVLLGRILGLVLMGIELTVLAIRGITLECPSCRERVTRPVYRCSGEAGCDAAHKRLVPGRYGVLFRVCRCGRLLPTLLLLGKLKLASQCSHCAYQLPRRGYSVQTLHIPVAGAPQVGKSVFMFASVKRLYDSVVGDETKRHFWADESFKNTFLQAKETIGNPEEMRKTTVTRPNAYNIYLGTGKLRRLVYLYDSAGEIYDDSRALSEADFYRFTKGLVLCVDPFSLAGLRKQVDAATLDNVRSLDKDPKDVLERLTENLREWRIRGRGDKLSIKLAVVLTKADALQPAQIPHPYASLSTLNGEGSRRAARDAAVRDWIDEVGVRMDLVTSITNNFQTTSFFVVSHREAASTDPRPQRAVNDDPADPVQWILNRRAFT
jgi:Double-GTPase 2